MVPIIVLDENGKDGKSKEVARSRRLSTSITESSNRNSASCPAIRKDSDIQASSEGFELGRSAVPITPSESAARQNPGSDTSRKGKATKKKLPSKSTKIGNANKKKGNPKSAENAPEKGADDQENRSENTHTNLGDDSEYDGGRKVTKTSMSETTDNRSSDVSGFTSDQFRKGVELFRDPADRQVSYPGRSIESTFVNPSQGHSSGFNINPSSFHEQGVNNSSTQGFQSQYPINKQPFHSGPPRFPTYEQYVQQHQQWISGQPPWYMPPYGPCNPWYSPPSSPMPPQSSSGRSIGGLNRPTSTESIITTQPPPTSVSSIITEPVYTRSLSVPSRKRGLLPSTVTSASMSTPITIASVPSRIKATTSRVSNPPSDDSPPRGRDDTATDSDLHHLFSKDAEPRDDVDDISVSGSEIPEIDEESIRVKFSRERLFPILKAAGMAANIEFEEEDKTERSLIFGGLGLSKRKIMPIVHMPPEVYTSQDEVRKFKGSLGGSQVFNTIFRVPEDDYEDLFRPPAFDQDAADFFASQNKRKQASFLMHWERDLVKMDREIRAVARLSAFQLIILNTLAIELSDEELVDDQPVPDGPFAMSRLAAEISAQQLTQLMRIAHATIPLRRENAYAGLAGNHKDEIVKKLKNLNLDSENLFAGKFTNTLKQIAKKIECEQTIGKTLQASVPSYSGRGKGSGAQKSSSNYRGQNRSHPYGGGGGSRGRGKRNENSAGGSGYQSNRNNNNQRRYGRGQGRARGRGRAQSRF